MKLYTSALSGPSRFIIVLADYLGIELELVELVLPKMEQKTPEHLARNPHGKIPVLEIEEGQYLYESVAIAHYLISLKPDHPIN